MDERHEYLARLMRIQARIDDCSTYNFGLRNADTLAHEDAQWMLDRIKELDRVETLPPKVKAEKDAEANEWAKKPENLFKWVPNMSDHWANRGGW